MMTVSKRAASVLRMNGDGYIATTWPELVHAAIIVRLDVLKHGRYSAFEILSGGDALGQPETISRPTQEVRCIPEP